MSNVSKPTGMTVSSIYLPRQWETYREILRFPQDDNSKKADDNSTKQIPRSSHFTAEAPLTLRTIMIQCRSFQTFAKVPRVAPVKADSSSRSLFGMTAGEFDAGELMRWLRRESA